MTIINSEQYIKIAKDLLYPPEIIKRIEYAKSFDEIERIMKAARYRRIDKDLNIENNHQIV